MLEKLRGPQGHFPCHGPNTCSSGHHWWGGQIACPYFETKSAFLGHRYSWRLCRKSYMHPIFYFPTGLLLSRKRARPVSSALSGHGFLAITSLNNLGQIQASHGHLTRPALDPPVAWQCSPESRGSHLPSSHHSDTVSGIQPSPAQHATPITREVSLEPLTTPTWTRSLLENPPRLCATSRKPTPAPAPPCPPRTRLFCGRPSKITGRPGLLQGTGPLAVTRWRGPCLPHPAHPMLPLLPERVRTNATAQGSKL